MSLLRLTITMEPASFLGFSEKSPPASMTHHDVPREDRLNIGLTDGLERFSVGIENVEDVVEDLERGLG